MSERTYTLDGAKVNRLRILRGLSVPQLADKCGVDRSTMVRWLKGGSVFSANLWKLSGALSVVNNELLSSNQISSGGDRPPLQDTHKVYVTIELNGVIKDNRPEQLRAVFVSLMNKIMPEIGLNELSMKVGVKILHSEHPSTEPDGVSLDEIEEWGNNDLSEYNKNTDTDLRD